MATSAASSPPRPVAGAFVTAQKGMPASAQEAKAREVVDFEEFVTCLALCGHLKYEEVEQMSLAQRVAGIVANFLGEKDEQQVLTEVLVPRAERMSTAGVVALPGMDTAVHGQFMSMWARMDLSHLFGFPLWEKAVFSLLHRSFPELQSIYVYYSRKGGAGSGSTSHRGSASHRGSTSHRTMETMQQAELVDLALDCGLATDAFPMARVQAVFARADATDDGKLGDSALELHEFLEAMVQLSFLRANPNFGEAGHDQKRGMTVLVLPDCLEQMLHKNVLQKAKTDTLGKVKKMAAKEPSVLASLKSLRPKLRTRFKKVGTPLGGAQEVFVVSQVALLPSNSTPTPALAQAVATTLALAFLRRPFAPTSSTTA